MKYSRIIGYNIKNEMHKRGLTKEEFAYKLNYSDIDVSRLLEGRLIITPNDIMDIAEELGVDEELLLNENFYIQDSKYVECMGEFTNKENQEAILDIIDMYIDLRESVELPR